MFLPVDSAPLLQVQRERLGGVYKGVASVAVNCLFSKACAGSPQSRCVGVLKG
jgi:hypothetical protein